MIITGAGGTLGREFMRQTKARGIDNNEWSLAEMQDYNLIMDDFIETPIEENETVIHCAAYKHIDLCEKNPDSCWENNVIKTKKLIERCRNESCEFIFISTDKAVEPTSIYGRSKKEIEDYLKNIKYGKIVRLGNIMASSGSVIPKWEKCIEEGRPLPITDPNMTRYMIPVEEAVSKIFNLLPKAKPGQVIIPEMGDPISIAELVSKVLLKHGIRPTYQPNYPSFIPDMFGYKHGFEMIGLRPGEKMHEKLLNDNEKEVYKDNNGGIYERHIG
jgi:UDP-N-acetylglucosamine 4,6-dehydratase